MVNVKTLRFLPSAICHLPFRMRFSASCQLLAASSPGAARSLADGGRARILLMDAGLLDIVRAFTNEVVAVIASAR